MPAPGDDRFFTELRGCTAELARIIDGDLERPVPTCPGWTFRQPFATSRRKINRIDIWHDLHARAHCG